MYIKKKNMITLLLWFLYRMGVGWGGSSCEAAAVQNKNSGCCEEQSQ